MIFLYKAGSFIFATSVKSDSVKFEQLHFARQVVQRWGFGPSSRCRLGTPPQSVFPGRLSGCSFFIVVFILFIPDIKAGSYL